MGISCIVKCAVPVADAKRSYDVYAEHFLAQIVARDIQNPEPSPVFNFHVEVPVTNVLKVIEYSDPEFEALTGCSRWPERDSIDPRDRDKWVEDDVPQVVAPRPDPLTVHEMTDEELEMIILGLDEI
jgi:hypothetical protein